MAYVSVNDFSTGITVEIDGELYQVLEFQHVKPGKGSPFVRAKFKNVRTGYTKENTFRGGEKLVRAHIERRKATFTYAQDDEYNFMETENFEQHVIPRERLGDSVKWLKEGMEVDLTFYGSEILSIELPNFVELEVTQTEPGFKGDTATGATKPATVETGAVVHVPLFLEEGTRIQIDTRTGEYLRRV